MLSILYCIKNVKNSLNMKKFNELFGNIFDDIYESTQDDCLMDSVRYPESIISFPISQKYEINNIALFQVTNDSLLKFIDIPINLSLCDIISDINTTKVYNISLLLNGVVVNTIPQRIFKLCGMYTEIKLRVFFDNTNIDYFTISYTGYLISDNNIREELRKNNFIDDELIYGNGMITTRY